MSTGNKNRYDMEKYCSIEMDNLLKHAKNLVGIFKYFMNTPTTVKDEYVITFFNEINERDLFEGEIFQFRYKKSCVDGTDELNSFLFKDGGFIDYLREGCDMSGCNTDFNMPNVVNENWDAYLRDEWDSLRAEGTPLELPWKNLDKKTKVKYAVEKLEEGIEDGVVRIVDGYLINFAWDDDTQVVFREATGEMIGLNKGDDKWSWNGNLKKIMDAIWFKKKLSIKSVKEKYDEIIDFGDLRGFDDDLNVGEILIECKRDTFVYLGKYEYSNKSNLLEYFWEVENHIKSWKWPTKLGLLFELALSIWNSWVCDDIEMDILESDLPKNC